MHNSLQEPEKVEKKEAGSWMTVIIGVVVALAIGISLWFLFQGQGRTASVSGNSSAEDDASGAGLP